MHLSILEHLCQSNPRCKALVVTVPDNPTSQIPSDAFLDAAAQILADHERFLVLDFAYKALWFHAMPRCFSWSPQDHPNVVMLHSNSKWLSSLGRRFGWVEADTAVIAGMEKINESVLLSPDTLHSMTTARFLEATLADGTLPVYIEDDSEAVQRTTAQSSSKPWTNISAGRGSPPAGGLYTCSPIPGGYAAVRVR